MHTGASVTSHTALIAATSNAGSSAIGMPALMSSMCAPAATCAMASARTRSMRPSFISAASTLRPRSEEHTSELQSRENLVCRLLLEKKKKLNDRNIIEKRTNDEKD